MVEIMAPAGSYESLRAAIKAGAGSVYFGIGLLNMRARSANQFTIEDLKKIARICSEEDVNSYLTVNTVLYNSDLKVMRGIIDAAKDAGISAIIACDIAAIEYANSIGVAVHMSTQANISNIEAVKFYSKYATVMVLARELTLDQIKEIYEEIKKQEIKGPDGKPVQIEIFIHGALCVAISGKCYMSLAQYNQSANRGLCLQACRRSYRVIDEQTGDELKIDNNHVMSPSDLCTIEILDRLLESGVSVLKIEGRGRSPDYVYKVVKTYKEAVDACEKGEFNQERLKEWNGELASVFNRGFWKGGYYLGEKTGEWSGIRGSKATNKKISVGTATNYFDKIKVAEFKLETNELAIGDKILIIGPTTGVIEAEVKELRIRDGDNVKNVKTVKKTKDSKNILFSIPITERVRKGDKLIKLIKREN